MPADAIHPDQPDGQARFRADLAAYLDSLSVHELAELLGELPSRRREPLQLDVLMVALNERLPDAYKLLPPAGHPGPGEGRRRSLRELVADRRAALAGVRVPTLVVHGQDDPMVRLEGGRAIAAAIPGARLVTFPGMGHDLPRELWPAICDQIRALADRAGDPGQHGPRP
jgi:pimeloyl-ACP methyl ester carboxylesterase